MSALLTIPLISVDEYLSTSYDPDVEFVDGVLVERNMGDWVHSLVQSNILFALRSKYPQWKVVAELRSRMTGTRYRIPDVSLVKTSPGTKYLFDPAFLVVEVLSERDVMSSVIEKLKGYLDKGVENIWLIDPRLKTIHMYRQSALIEMEGESISTVDGQVEISRSDIFAE